MPESITATSTRLPVASLCASGRLSRSGAYWSEFICGSCSCASENRKFACAPATWVSPDMLRIMSGTLVPPSMRQRNSRRPVRRKVCVSMRVIAWRPEIALSCASDTLVGTSRITSLGTNGAPGGGRLKPLRRAVVVVAFGCAGFANAAARWRQVDGLDRRRIGLRRLRWQPALRIREQAPCDESAERRRGNAADDIPDGLVVRIPAGLRIGRRCRAR